MFSNERNCKVCSLCLFVFIVKAEGLDLTQIECICYSRYFEEALYFLLVTRHQTFKSSFILDDPSISLSFFQDKNSREKEALKKAAR